MTINHGMSPLLRLCGSTHEERKREREGGERFSHLFLLSEVLVEMEGLLDFLERLVLDHHRPLGTQHCKIDAVQV